MAKNTDHSEVILLEDVELRFRNFAGEAGKFNAAGNRNFSVLLTPEMADNLDRAGYNIKTLKPKDEDDNEQPYLKVRVNFNGIPPKIILISGKKKTPLNEETVGMLDWAEITNCDMTITPYKWEVNDATGVTAYLKSMYVTIYEDDLDRKYADLED